MNSIMILQLRIIIPYVKEHMMRLNLIIFLHNYINQIFKKQQRILKFQKHKKKNNKNN